MTESLQGSDPEGPHWLCSCHSYCPHTTGVQNVPITYRLHTVTRHSDLPKPGSQDTRVQVEMLGRLEPHSQEKRGLRLRGEVLLQAKCQASGRRKFSLQSFQPRPHLLPCGHLSKPHSIYAYAEEHPVGTAECQSVTAKCTSQTQAPRTWFLGQQRIKGGNSRATYKAHLEMEQPRHRRQVEIHVG